MSYTKKTGTFLSSNGITQIKYYIFEPYHTPKAILQLSHGMCDYIERYQTFISFLTSQDILVCGNDHLGHKGSILSKDDLGFFAPKNGWKFLVKDCAKMTFFIKKKYPTYPVFLLGHSMGSFVSRLYITRYSHLIQGVILSGTSGTNILTPFGLLFSNVIKRCKGARYRSNFMNFLVLGGFNAGCKSQKTCSDWLTKDETILDTYLKDEFCNFTFTISAFHDLISMLHIVSTNYWYRLVPTSLPLHLVSGDMDPLGNYGIGIEDIYARLKRHGVKKVSLQLYKDCRHELAFELAKETFFQDTLNWIEKLIKS